MKNIAKCCFLCSIVLANVSWSADEKDMTEYRLESVIVGDKEQPAVSYFIPWQGTSTPDKLEWSLDVKYDQTLDLVDRDVMRRSMHIYDEMKLEAQDVVSQGGGTSGQ